MERHPEQIRDYNEDDRCTGCGVHVSEGHLPQCVLSNESAEHDWTPPIEVHVQCGEAADVGQTYSAWIDFSQSREKVQKALDDFLRRSPVEGSKELMMIDYTGFHGLEDELSRFSSLDTVHTIARAIKQGGEAMAVWLKCIGAKTEDIKEQVESFWDHYLGEYKDEWDYVASMIGEVYPDGGVVQQIVIEEILRGMTFIPSPSGGSVHAFSAKPLSTT